MVFNAFTFRSERFLESPEGVIGSMFGGQGGAQGGTGMKMRISWGPNDGPKVKRDPRFVPSGTNKEGDQVQGSVGDKGR